MIELKNRHTALHMCPMVKRERYQILGEIDFIEDPFSCKNLHLLNEPEFLWVSYVNDSET